jgi:hypothetical protein
MTLPHDFLGWLILGFSIVAAIVLGRSYIHDGQLNPPAKTPFKIKMSHYPDHVVLLRVNDFCRGMVERIGDLVDYGFIRFARRS